MASVTNPSPEQLQVLLNGPALRPPPGVIPQLNHPPNLQTTGRAVQIVCLALSTLALSMRLYTKARIIRQVVLADYAIALGWAVFVAYFAPSWLASDIAGGVHQWDLRLKHLSSFLYYIHIGSVMYGICIWFIKLSILLQYLQIFVPIKKASTMYLTCHALIWTNFVFYFVSTFAEIFACSPVRKAWDPLVTRGRCINILALNVVASTLNSASDLGILIVPQVSIWRLQMSLHRKIQISAIFLIGVFACVASIVRLAYAIKLYTHTDLTYYTWLAGLWTHPEMASGIIVACLPVSPKFFQNLQQPRFFSQIGSSLQSLLRFHTNGSRRSTKDRSISRRISPQRMSWPKSYEMLSDEQRLKGGKTAGFRDVSVDASFADGRPQQARPHIIRTVDVDAKSESRRESDSDCANGPQSAWQGSSSYNVSVMV